MIDMNTTVLAVQIRITKNSNVDTFSKKERTLNMYNSICYAPKPHSDLHAYYSTVEHR